MLNGRAHAHAGVLGSTGHGDRFLCARRLSRRCATNHAVAELGEGNSASSGRFRVQARRRHTGNHVDLEQGQRVGIVASRPTTKSTRDRSATTKGAVSGASDVLDPLGHTFG